MDNLGNFLSTPIPNDIHYPPFGPWRKKKTETKLVLEGILESVSEIGTTYLRKHNGIIGPGNRSWLEKSGHYTLLKVKTKDETKEIRYNGVVLQDSIGHKMQVYEKTTNRRKRTEILDVELERWYK